MKRIAIIFALLVAATGLVFAKRIIWDEKKAPALSLPEAYNCALSAIGSATNVYHCVAAECLISRSKNGEWMISFSDSKGNRKTAFVFFDRTTRTEDGLIVF
jgi:hypothetical protein